MQRLKKLLNLTNFDMNRIYEKYNRLTTEENRNRFSQVMYSVLACAVTLIFIWYYGIGLNLKRAMDEPHLVKDSKQLTLNEFNKDGNSIIVSPQYGKTGAKNSENAKTSENVDKGKNVNNPSKPEEDLNRSKEQKHEPACSSIKKVINKGANTTMVSVTFDDGYNKKNIEKVLDVLKRNNIKSTFFIIGKVLDDYPDVWKRAINDGHQICNHTNYHENLTNMPDKLVKAEIQGWEDSARKVLGDAYVIKMKKEFPYLRLPGGGGARSNRILSIAQQCGYTVIGWNLETFSSVISPYKKKISVQAISNKIEQHVVSRCSNGSIVLLHFNQYDTGNIEGIIQGIKKRGFNMQPISKLVK